MGIIKDHPVFFTATIKNWKRLLQPEKYKKIIIEESNYPICLLHHE
jgi:hypothetical protein